MQYLIQSLALNIVSRRLHGFPEDEAGFTADSDAETEDLLLLAKQSAVSLIDISAKAKALSATPFCTNGMVDAPAPGELELLQSLMADVRAA